MSADLRTSYMGIELASPLVAGASPLSGTMDGLLALEEAGASAIVLQSLFEEQIEHHELSVNSILETGTDSFPEAHNFFPGLDDYNTGPESYLQLVEQAKARLGVPVIASLNGVSRGGWIRYARLLEEAGADALELNIYYIPVDADVTGEQVEQKYIDLVQAVKKEVTIPVSVKLGPYFSSMANMAKRLDAAGADGLVLFNRFYQPDYDLEALEVVPNLILSNSHELLLRLHWIAVIYGSIKADLALTGGVHSATDVVKSMMAGAKVAMMTSALLKRGITFLDTIATELLVWMGEHEYDSIKQMQGSMSRNAVPQPGAFERSNYMKVLSSYAMR